MNILLIGRNGQLASELQLVLPSLGNLYVLGSHDFDIKNEQDCFQKISRISPSVIINASAYTAVDKAESDIEAAYGLNEKGIYNLVNAAKINRARIIHVSTDFVFDGDSTEPYKTSEPVNPKNVYGASKAAGEKVLLEKYEGNYAIVRTSWVYSSFGNNFVKTMLRLLSQKDSLSVVNDQVGAPTYAKELANFIVVLVEKNLKGVFNWSDIGSITWYDFATEIQNLGLKYGILTKKIQITPIFSSGYPTPAKRPKYSVLEIKNSNKLLKSNEWTYNLDRCIKDISIFGHDKNINFLSSVVKDL